VKKKIPCRTFELELLRKLQNKFWMEEKRSAKSATSAELGFACPSARISYIIEITIDHTSNNPINIPSPTASVKDRESRGSDSHSRVMASRIVVGYLSYYSVLESHSTASLFVLVIQYEPLSISQASTSAKRDRFPVND
jgi:hypothetical protein